jgi:cyclophilin family peptidyl-prolyl cis-trans isomerase
MRALGDEDAETAAWGAYGLGFSCKGHEDARVRAIVARSASLDLADAGAPTAPIDLHFAIARALGKCGGALAEATLAGWIRNKGKSAWAREQAAYGIGDIGAKRGVLDDDTITALLDASADGVATALYPFARAERFNDAFAARLLDAAKKALTGPKSDTRVFAVRSLPKAGDGAIAELSRVATSADFTWPERTDAMRSLAKLGDGGRAAAADALSKIVPDAKDPFAVLTLGGDVYGEIVVGLGALGQTPPASANKVLSAIAAMRPAGEAPATLARRLAELRCTAASLLSQGAYASQTINACDAANSEPWERARLAALLRRPLALDRRAAWLALTKTEHLRVREDALAAVRGHPELGDVGLQALADALADTKHPGVVAAATEILVAHPERVLVLSSKERRNALDPNAPPPSANPQQETSPVIAKALAAALAFKWPDDAFETRAGLIDAAAALHAPTKEAAKNAAKVGCSDPNITMREHAAKALRALGEDKIVCAAPPSPPVAKETNAPHGGKLVLTTDAGTLSITFDADLAPIASTRILDLAKAGFYDNVVVHRVVPAFVVQLGDPQGDGYNGSGTSLRCETSPVPFGPLDVGIALAGRDTGSSQFFVTLARFPHLDGDYARIGRAEGDWLAVAEGDVVKSVKVE